MNDSTKQIRLANKRRNLTIKFCLAALLVTSFVVVIITVVSYFQLTKQGLELSVESLARTINVETSRTNGQSLKTRNLQQLAEYWQKLSMFQGVESITFYDANKELIWSSTQATKLTSKEQSLIQKMQQESGLSVVNDRHVPEFSNIRKFLGDNSRKISAFISLKDKQGNTFGILKLVRRYTYILLTVEETSKRIFWIILLGNMFLFIVLLSQFLRRLGTINEQEEELNLQIIELSKLLNLNKTMRKNMKTASSRAVELNEQFLRRVGSDLHDGPAQSIGYAVMRLDRVSKEEVAKKFNQDFYIVKEALDSALDEIRGISSGLVLPELEELTITEALQKVVARHTASFDTEVTSFLTDLPEHITLPIKICAYRFAQEGMNNAHRHGQAEKCRLTAYVKDDVLHLSLKDNGMGFRKSQLIKDGGHLGLMGLKDRIESLGGTFNINSELGVGTAIKMSIALSDEL